MLRILWGPFVIATILPPPNTTTPGIPCNTTSSLLNATVAAPNILTNSTLPPSNVTNNQTQPSSTKWDPGNSSIGKNRRKANTYIKYPYLVSINKETENHSISQFCSGSILTVSVVLTACQCVGIVSTDSVERYPADTLVIIAGTSKATENSTEKQHILVTSVEPHSKCRRVGHLVEFDLGLMFSKTDIRLRNGVALVPVGDFNARSVMDEYNFILKFKSVCYSPGWAYMRPRTDDKLLIDIVDNPVWMISDEECRQSHCLEGRKNLCTARFETQGHVCGVPYSNATPGHADVGGPLICDRHLYGVISTSESRSSRLPQMYVSPNVVLQFIEKFIPSYTASVFSHLRTISVSTKIQLCTFLLWLTTMVSVTIV
uniref:Mast cell protease 2 n=1 Tax=Lygus hesperus TaxID=30085 RepID=A0A0A9VX49_LYGHE